MVGSSGQELTTDRLSFRLDIINDLSRLRLDISDGLRRLFRRLGSSGNRLIGIPNDIDVDIDIIASRFNVRINVNRSSLRLNNVDAI